jgi:predicted Zn-dependent protease
MKKLIWIFLVSIGISGCSSLPGLKAPSEREINLEAENAYREVKKKSKVSKNRKWTNMVNRVARRIASASNEPFKWEVILIESDQVNAWCMPGGKMAVYTGIMPVLETEAALAAVMGHEVAHATLRHGHKGYARALKSKMTGLLVGGAAILGGELLCKTKKCKNLTKLGALASGFAIQFFDRKFSRKDETASDKVGQIYMAKAGYDPREAPRVWQRMAKASGGKAPLEWMSTHPASSRRQKNLSNWLPETSAIYQNLRVKYGLGEKIK